MVCELRLKAAQTAEQRTREIRETLARLEQQLQKGTARLVIGANGAAAITGWTDRNDVSDVCAIRALTAAKSFALSRAVAQAEAGGRKLSLAAVNSGLHSHDGGKTWHPGH